jgi:hypothetical protein
LFFNRLLPSRTGMIAVIESFFINTPLVIFLHSVSCIDS